MVLPGPDVSKKKGEVEEEIVVPPVTNQVSRHGSRK
jgi:hypothetical protein